MRRRHGRHNRFGALDMKSPLLWAAVAAVGVGAVMLFSKKAKADELPGGASAGSGAGGADADVPVGVETGAEKTQAAGGGTVTVSKDPATGVVIAGPTGTIAEGVKRTVAKGESWSNIASRTYGDYRWWPFLWDSNRMGTKYADPGLLYVGDEIVVPVKPSDAGFMFKIFARAKADRQWEIDKVRAKKAGKSFNTPRPASTFEMTALPLPIKGTGSVSAPSAASSVSTSAGSGGYSQNEMDALESEMRQSIPRK